MHRLFSDKQHTDGAGAAVAGNGAAGAGHADFLEVLQLLHLLYRKLQLILRQTGMGYKYTGQVQIIPIGITFGRKVYGFAEYGAGFTYLGGSVGIGYRF